MKLVKKNDAILIIAILVFALILFAIFYICAKPGNQVIVIVDGATVEKHALNNDYVSNIKTAYGENTLIIKDGKAYVSSADCPDKVCVSHRKISLEGETIICLPHKLVISIESD